MAVVEEGRSLMCRPHTYPGRLSANLICSLIGTAFPQILFFGYSTLDAILAYGAAASASTSVAETSDALSTLSAALSSTNLPIFENIKGFEGSGSTGDNVVAAADLLALLGQKLIATALCLGTGLVGGTFAPSLFFGAVLGVAYQDFAGSILSQLADAIAAYQTSIGIPVGSWGVIPQLTLADAPAYAMVGAASTLAAVFRAPLTASVIASVRADARV